MDSLSTIAPSGVLFRQLFDKTSSTYTYLLADSATKDAVLIDPVDEQVDRDLAVVEGLGLHLRYVLNTHTHADHITGSGLLKRRVEGVQSVIGDSATKADVHVAHGDSVKCGGITLNVRGTPGHTEGCVTYVLADESKAFTGDTLLIRGCGRTDFQGGSSEDLYDSVHGQIFSLPPTCELYPAHDYKGRTVTTVAEEVALNPRLTKTKEEFVKLMGELGLSYPAKIDVALPANRMCGFPDSA